jgi:hypothetical protein
MKIVGYKLMGKAYSTQVVTILGRKYYEKILCDNFMFYIFLP